MGIIQDSQDSADGGQGTKRCCKCGGYFPATTDYFGRDSKKKDGFRYDCKACANQSRRDARLALKKQTEVPPKCPEGMKQCRNCDACLPATTDYFARDKKGELGLHYWCKPCCHQHSNRYKREHKAEMADYMRRYEEERHEERQAYKKQYRAENRDDIREWKREYRIVNHERLLKEKRQYDSENREKSIQRAHKRRAKARQNGGKYNDSQIAALYIFQQGRCCWCGKTMVNRITNRNASRHEKFTIDHITPIVRSGSNYWWNLILACFQCNSSHHARYVFLEWQPPQLLADTADYLLQVMLLELRWQYWRWCFIAGIRID